MSRATEKVGRGREREQVRRSTKNVMDKADASLDQDARDTANDALAASKAHELICDLRWKTHAEAMIRVEAALVEVNKAIHDKIGRMPAGVIAALTGLVGFLAARAFPVH
jgi:hypothetical protein